jgi:predicted extracellular nuclease
MLVESNIAFWNVENLFDREDDPNRPPELQATLAGELQGWTAAIRDQKIQNLASIINQMFNGQGPDLLGVCEVENEAIVQRLANQINIPGRNYGIVAHNSPDARGIDVSFIFDQNTLQAADPSHQVVIKRTATRDLFWCTFTVTATNREFVAIANHWPSRSAGQYESEPFRMLTGETLSFVLSGLLANNPDVPILAMGDFNDEPFNRSMQEYLLGSRDPGRVTGSPLARLLNLMWPLMQGDDPGTFLFSSTWNMLDQFLVSKEFIKNTSKVRVVDASTAMFKPQQLKGPAGAAKKYGRPAKPSSFDQTGFSDHYPIVMKIKCELES